MNTDTKPFVEPMPSQPHGGGDGRPNLTLGASTRSQPTERKPFWQQVNLREALAFDSFLWRGVFFVWVVKWLFFS